MYSDYPFLEADHGSRRLRAAGAALDRLARHLVRVERAPLRSDPMIEFHAEAGAPEGALYLDGKFVETRRDGFALAMDVSAYSLVALVCLIGVAYPHLWKLEVAAKIGLISMNSTMRSSMSPFITRRP